MTWTLRVTQWNDGTKMETTGQVGGVSDFSAAEWADVYLGMESVKRIELTREANASQGD